jgi:hypothetical protein
MALRGHHYFDLTTAQLAQRLAGLWPPIRLVPKELEFKHLPTRPFQVEARKSAMAIYAGEQSIDGQTFADLSWLNVFAQSGRQLLMCHALTLLKGWTALRPVQKDLGTEVTILRQLIAAAPDFSNLLHPSLLQPLAAATQKQIQTVVAARPKDAHDYLTKAQILLEASRVLTDGFSLNQQAVQLFDHALPELIANDGGPLLDNFECYEAWLGPLFNALDVTFPALAQNALDRAAPFLSMLVGADGRYCFGAKTKPTPAVLAATPLQQARHSKVARLQAGKAVVILLPEQSSRAANLCFSSHGKHLLNAELINCGPALETTLDLHQSQDGNLLVQTSADFKRTVFINPAGDDMRVEDQFVALHPAPIVRFKFDDETKMSVARNGTQATIAGTGKSTWQLTLRGAELSPTPDDTVWHVRQTRKTVNWALKRITKNNTKLAKQETAELPF